MDLKIPNELPRLNPAVKQVGDLLAQLKAAGTIEAQVVKLLKDNQLLLTSRLGQILTSNSLDYKPGDRVNLRLDESSGQPVLKASPAAVKPIRLDSRENPELTRLLPPERPMLARVARIVAQRAEIQIADNIVRLPRQLMFPRNQILSLQREDSQRSIEIRPLQPKAIYKAILKQLLPRETQSSPSGLVRLLGLVNAAAGEVRARPSNPRPIDPTARSNGTTKAQVTDSRIETRRGHDPAQVTYTVNKPATPRRPRFETLPPDISARSNIAPAKSESPRTPSTTLPAESSAATARPAAANTGAKPSAVTLPVPARAEATTRQAATAAVDPATAIKATPGKNPVATGNTLGKNTVPPGVDTRDPVVRVTKNPPAVPAQPARAQTKLMGKLGQAPASVPVNINPAAPVPGIGASATLPSLQPLLQLVTLLAEVDAAQIKKWFEFARLTRSVQTGTASATPADILKTLQPLADRENLGRELMQVLRQNPAVQAEADSPATKAAAQEAQWLHREGAKLVEQSLSQNLLQRATLGLQQETQQPLSLSLALPFVDEQQIRPLYIDLEQRGQARNEDEKTWEVRLNFELGELGCIACHLVLAGLAVTASFYSENEQTRTRIETELPLLRQQLSRAGFDPGEFHSFHGRPTPGRQPAARDFSESLVDIEV